MSRETYGIPSLLASAIDAHFRPPPSSASALSPTPTPRSSLSTLDNEKQASDAGAGAGAGAGGSGGAGGGGGLITPRTAALDSARRRADRRSSGFDSIVAQVNHLVSGATPLEDATTVTRLITSVQQFMRVAPPMIQLQLRECLKKLKTLEAKQQSMRPAVTRQQSSTGTGTGTGAPPSLPRTPSSSSSSKLPEPARSSKESGAASAAAAAPPPSAAPPALMRALSPPPKSVCLIYRYLQRLASLGGGCSTHLCVV